MRKYITNVGKKKWTFPHLDDLRIEFRKWNKFWKQSSSWGWLFIIQHLIFYLSGTVWWNSYCPERVNKNTWTRCKISRSTYPTHHNTRKNPHIFFRYLRQRCSHTQKIPNRNGWEIRIFGLIRNDETCSSYPRTTSYYSKWDQRESKWSQRDATHTLTPTTDDGTIVEKNHTSHGEEFFLRRWNFPHLVVKT